MIYYDPDEPEAGYFGEDEVVPCESSGAKGCGSRDCTGWAVVSWEDRLSRHVDEAPCSICEAAIPEDATVPLCTNCRKTAEAHGKQMADAQRYPDPEHR